MQPFAWITAGLAVGLERCGLSWITTHGDLNPKEDERFLHDVQKSPEIDALLHKLSEIETFAEGAPGCRTLHARLGATSRSATAIVNGWRRGATLNGPFWALVLFMFFLLVWPDVVAFRLHERAFNARSLPAKVRTLFIIISLLGFRPVSVRLMWRSMEDRLLATLPLLVLYSLPAFNGSLRHLYGSTWYTVLVGVLSLLWLIVLSFTAEIVKVYQHWRIRRCTKQDECRVRAQQHKAELGAHVEQFYALYFRYVPKMGKPVVSRHTLVQSANLKSDFASLVETLDVYLGVAADDVDGRNWWTRFVQGPAGATRYPRMPKVLVLFFCVAVQGFSIFTYIKQPLLLVQVVAQTFWIVGRMFLFVVAGHLSLEDTLDLFSNVVGANLLVVFLVGIPLLASNGAVFDDNVAFAVITVVLTLLTVTVTDWLAPGFLWLCAKCNIVTPHASDAPDVERGDGAPADEKAASHVGMSSVDGDTSSREGDRGGWEHK